MVYQRNKKAKGDPPLRQQSKRGLQHPAGQWPGWTGLCAGRFRSAARLTGRTAGRPGANRPLRSCHPGGLLQDTSGPRSRSGLPPGLDRRVRSLDRSDRMHDRAPRRRPSSALMPTGGSTARHFDAPVSVRSATRFGPAGPVAGPVQPAPAPDAPVCGPVDRESRGES